MKDWRTTNTSIDNPQNQMWWQVGTNAFFNKYEAIFDYINNPRSFHFFCNDFNWDRYNWEIEPTQDIEHLYKQHAINLRQKYKILGLAYSGGVDSQTVLNTFVKNNITLDFIVTWRDLLGDLNHPANAEQKKAVQFLQKNKNKFRNTEVITEPDNVNFADLTRSTYVSAKSILDLHHENSAPQVGAMTHLRNMSKKYFDIISQDPENCALIIGHDKPDIKKDSTGWYWQSVDMSIMEVGMSGIELFYMNNLDPTIMIKQCHMAVKFLETHFPNLTSSKQIILDDNKQNFEKFMLSIGRSPAYDPIFYTKNSVHGASPFNYDCIYKQGGAKHIIRYELQRQNIDNVRKIYYDHMELYKKNQMLFSDTGVTVGWLSKKRLLKKISK